MDARKLMPLWLWMLAAVLPVDSAGASWPERLDAIRHGSAPGAPGDTLTFDAALLRAFDYSPSVRATTPRLEAAQAATGQAGARPNPILSSGCPPFGAWASCPCGTTSSRARSPGRPIRPGREPPGRRG
jgi:hypothetical protein